MNRYIITKEQLNGQEYLISALYDENKKLLEVYPDLLESSSILGNIYIARVENIVKNLNAAFVKISPGQTCYLSLEDVKNPVFTKKLSQKKLLVAGDELLVQVSKEAIKTKEPSVTTNLSFSGTYTVLTSGNCRHSVSSKLSQNERAHYQQMLDEVCKEENFGVIIRTNAAGASDDEILKELKRQKEEYFHLIETAKHKTVYSLLYQEANPYKKHLQGLRQSELAEVVTDDRGIFEELCESYHISRENLMTSGSVSVPVSLVTTESGIRIRYYQDEVLSLSSLYSLKENLKSALNERVWLKSGAYLIIQPTEALTVIDVNTGKNIAKKAVQENFLKVNKEAAAEIARQLRLRNISGMILIDFINLTSKKAEEELLTYFRSLLKQDSVPTQMIDMTKLGLVEVTRKKVKKSLAEQCKI